MLIMILLFFTCINGKNIGEIMERHRTAPVQDCKKSFETYNTEYNSTVLLDRSADGRYGRFRWGEKLGRDVLILKFQSWWVSRLGGLLHWNWNKMQNSSSSANFCCNRNLFRRSMLMWSILVKDWMKNAWF